MKMNTINSVRSLLRNDPADAQNILHPVYKGRQVMKLATLAPGCFREASE